MIVRGARQVGKSTLVRLFAQSMGLHLYEVDLERYPALQPAFASRDLARILREIEFLLGEGTIEGEKTVLFLDEIQAIPEAIPVLRDFYEERPDLSVLAAGSLLEFALQDANFSMPVGRVDYLYLEPMSFEEFLEACGNGDLLKLVQGYNLSDTFPETAHSRLLNCLRDYVLVGGMPEAVLRFVETRDYSEARNAHRSILQTYRDDFSKYATKAELRRIQKIFDYVPRGIGEKLKYVRVDGDEQARDLRRAIELLTLARVIRIVYHSDGTGVPLGATINEKIYKPYFLDIGLVNTACGLNWISDDEIRSVRFVNEGMLAEQFAAQHLPAIQGTSQSEVLSYWLREGRSGNAEVDFLMQQGGEVVPVEIKAGLAGSLKSLHLFMKSRNKSVAIRLSQHLPRSSFVQVSGQSGNEKERHSFRLLSLPLYLVEQLPRLLANIEEAVHGGWMKREFAIEEVAKGAVGILQDKYIKLFMNAGSPKNAALFASSDLAEGGDSTVYFSPDATAIASELVTEYGMEATIPPSGEVVLLVGWGADSELDFG